MSSEETELRFIRCPDCRSLVPAIASRCRMCGHQFDGTPEAEASKPEAEKLEAEKPEAEKPEAEKLEKGAKTKGRVRQRTMSESKDEVDSLTKEVLDASPEAGEADVSPSGPFRLGRELRAEATTVEETSEDVDESTEQDAEIDGEESSLDSKAEPKRKRKRRRRRRGSEGAGGPLHIEEMAEKVKNDESPGVRAMEQSETVEQGSDMKVRQMVDSSVAPVTGVSPEGKLIGWIVSFQQDPKGVGGELRSGQFFVGRQRLRDSDMVIGDSSISTPHCLVSVSGGEGMKLQDLMSEHGTFVRRHGSESFVRITEPMTVEHGDWLRFGMYEVMICLIP